jgi:hypothetical protein
LTGAARLAALAGVAFLAACTTQTLSLMPEPAAGPAVPPPAPASTPISEAVPSGLTYVAPITPIARAETVLVDSSPAAVLAAVRQRLEAERFTVAYSEREDVVVATHRGNAEPYVDCGTIFVFERGMNAPPTRIPAVAEQATITAVPGQAIPRAERAMRLDARVTVQVVPEAGRARVTSRADYILTKLVTLAGRPGPQREVVAFSSGAEGKFGKGTTCRPTGMLERLPLAGLPLVPES